MHRASALITLLMILAGSVFAQMSYDDLNLEAIPFRKVKHYIEAQKENAQITYLSDIKPTCDGNCELDDFYAYTKTYRVKASKHMVWQTYKNASPTVSWTTRKSTCAMVYERTEDEVYYGKESLGGIEPGQVLFMDLKLLKGLYHLATSFEITKVQDEIGVIEVNYTEAGINQGVQVIRMTDTGDGYTLVEHASFIKSGHRFRDRYLYPYFHTKLINAFHRKMRRLVHEGSLLSEVSQSQ